MSYRDLAGTLSAAAGDVARRLRGALSRRLIVNEESTGDRVTALGREAFDGSHEQDEMDQFSPVGIIGRAAKNAAVEALAAFIGADGSHPVSVSCLDSTRRVVIDAVGLNADETLVYTSKSVVKILDDGTVEIRSLEGTAQPLAFLDSVNARIDNLEARLNARIDDLQAQQNAHVAAYNAHTHLHGPYAPAPPPAGLPIPTALPLPTQSPIATASVQTDPVKGTEILKAE